MCERQTDRQSGASWTHQAQNDALREVVSVDKPCTDLNHWRSLSTRDTRAMGICKGGCVQQAGSSATKKKAQQLHMMQSVTSADMGVWSQPIRSLHAGVDLSGPWCDRENWATNASTLRSRCPKEWSKKRFQQGCCKNGADTVSDRE